MQNKLIHESRTCTPHSKKRSNPHSKIKNCPCFLSKIAFFQFCLGDFVSCLMLLQSYGRKTKSIMVFYREKRANYTETKNQSPFHALREKHRELFWANSQWMRIMIKSQQELQRLNAESCGEMQYDYFLLHMYQRTTSSLRVCQLAFLVDTNRYIAQQSMKGINAHK